VPAAAALPGMAAPERAAADARADRRALYFATGGERGVVRLWRGDTGRCVYELRPGARRVRGCMACRRGVQLQSVLRPCGVTFYIHCCLGATATPHGCDDPHHRWPFPAGAPDGAAPAAAPAPAGEELTGLALLPRGAGLLALTGDCRALLLRPMVRRHCPAAPVLAGPALTCTASQVDSMRPRRRTSCTSVLQAAMLLDVLHPATRGPAPYDLRPSAPCAGRTRAARHAWRLRPSSSATSTR
jgi:hypothetical protein